MGNKMHNIILQEPLIEPISIDEAKIYLRIDMDHENALMERLIKVARKLVEEYCGRALITQTHRLHFSLDDCRENAVVLPVAPFQNLTSQLKVSEGKHESVVSNIRINKSRPQARIMMPNFYSKDTEFRVDYRCGYGDSALDVPDPIRQAMLLLVADLYENRSEVTTGNKLSGIVRSLLSAYRILHLL